MKSDQQVQLRFCWLEPFSLVVVTFCSVLAPPLVLLVQFKWFYHFGPLLHPACRGCHNLFFADHFIARLYVLKLVTSTTEHFSHDLQQKKKGGCIRGFLFRCCLQSSSWRLRRRDGFSCAGTQLWSDCYDPRPFLLCSYRHIASF